MLHLKGSSTAIRRLWLLCLRLAVLSFIFALVVAGSVPVSAAPPHSEDWPDCKWSCNAGDVTVNDVWLGDADGNPFTGCTGTTTAHIWVSFDSNPEKDRYYGAMLDVVIGSQRTDHHVSCIGGPIKGQTTTTADVFSFQWACGTAVTVENLIIFWDNKADSCGDPTCAKFANAQCDWSRDLHLYAPCDLEVEIEEVKDPTLDCDQPQITLYAEATGDDALDDVDYQWYLDGVAIPGSTDYWHYATAAGIYSVVVSTDRGCTATSNNAVLTRDPEGPTVTVSPTSAKLCPTGEVVLTATPGPIGVSARPAGLAAPVDITLYTLQWYRDGAEIPEATGTTYTATEPGAYWVLITRGDCPGESNHVVVSGCEPPPSCTRADVSVIIYGGWNGIPVKAWVAGTAQPTMYTARDAHGEAAVLWTFYPPEGATWSVSVQPQLPAGLDPARWQLKLVSSSDTVSISRCSGRTLYFQLVDTKPKDPTPVPLLPVTGGEPALPWWQALAQWLLHLVGL